MSIHKMLQMESDSVTSQPIKIPFEFTDISSLPKNKKIGDSIVISPIKVRTWFKLKPLLLSISKEDLDLLISKEGTSYDTSIQEIMSKYDHIIFEIVCIGIHNKKDDMPKWFSDVLKDNCSFEDLYILLNAILFRIGCNSFINSIMLMKSMSPLTEAEIIALQKNKESWNNHKAVSCSSPSATKH